MATKKRVKRYNGDDESMVNAPNRGIVDQTEEEAANEAAMTMRQRAMAEGDRDEKAMPKQDFMSSKEPEAPAMRKTAMRKPKPSGVSDTGTKLRAMDNAMAPKKPETLDERRSRRATEFKELLGRRSPMAAARDAMKPKFKASSSYASGGSVSASSRADGIATKGKTRGKIC
jgi:hypothetical protein